MRKFVNKLKNLLICVSVEYIEPEQLVFVRVTVCIFAFLPKKRKIQFRSTNLQLYIELVDCVSEYIIEIVECLTIFNF